MKWLKVGQIKILYFIQFFLRYILFGKNFIDDIKEPLHSVCLILNHEKAK